MGFKIDRISTDVQRELTAILRTVKDPRVATAFVTVTSVRVTRDMKFAKV